GHLDLEVEEEPYRLFTNLAHHRLVHGEALTLVLDQRVALGHRPQPDAVLEVVHLVEVVAPAAVDHREHHAALQLTHGRLTQRVGALLVGNTRVREQLAAQEVAGYPTARTRLVEYLVDRDRHREERAEFRPESVEIPIIGVPLSGVLVDDLVDDILKELLDAILQVIALEDVTAVTVDRLTLTVQHVVVLEHVLADLSVARLHLRLGAADGTADDLRFDRQVVWHVAATHDRLSCARIEQAHQVIRQREV